MSLGGPIKSWQTPSIPINSQLKKEIKEKEPPILLKSCNTLAAHTTQLVIRSFLSFSLRWVFSFISFAPNFSSPTAALVP